MTDNSPPALPDNEQQPAPDSPGSPQESPVKARISTITALIAAWPRGRKILAASSVLALIAIIVIAVIVLSGGPMTVHGTLLDESYLTGGSGCGENSGSQVLITDPSGSVLAVTTLREDVKAERKLEASPAAKQLASESNALNALGGGAAVDSIGFYRFTATIPSGDSNYGVKVGSGHVVWFTNAQMTKGPGLNCGG